MCWKLPNTLEALHFYWGGRRRDACAECAAFSKTPLIWQTDSSRSFPPRDASGAYPPKPPDTERAFSPQQSPYWTLFKDDLPLPPSTLVTPILHFTAAYLLIPPNSLESAFTVCHLFAEEGMLREGMVEVADNYFNVLEFPSKYIWQTYTVWNLRPSGIYLYPPIVILFCALTKCGVCNKRFIICFICWKTIKKPNFSLTISLVPTLESGRVLDRHKVFL